MTTGCFCCRVLNDTLQVLFELRCHVWSSLAKRNPEVSWRRSPNQWREQTNTGINFQHGYLNRPYSELFLSNNGRNQRWSKCMTILIYELWFCHKSDNKMHSFNWVKWQRDHILLCDPIQQLILKASNEQSWFHDRPKGEVHSSKEQYWIYWDAPTQDASSK